MSEWSFDRPGFEPHPKRRPLDGHASQVRSAPASRWMADLPGLIKWWCVIAPLPT
jgi:hypothetical protein